MTRALLLLGALALGCSGEAGDPPVECLTDGAEYTVWQDEQYTHVQRTDTETFASRVKTIDKSDTIADFGDVAVEVQADLTVCLVP